MKPRIISAIVRRELTSYFSSPTGYVFITIFIFLSAFAAFWLPVFFQRNLANLDQLNAWFPALLLLIVPAITMGAWADERKQGTDELLLTLPAHDWQLVMGKYFACLLIYTAALAFSVSHVLVLSLLGQPDLGLMFSTYLGYWLSGAGLLAVGLVASALTGNLTISFILAAMLSAVVVGVGALASIFPGAPMAESLGELSLPARFAEFGKGIIALPNIAYFVLLAGLGLWLNTVIISRRHWSGASGAARRSALALVRGGAFVVIAATLVTLLGRTPLRADATAEQLWSISPQTRALVKGLDPDQSVLITAYVSPDVPASYVQTRETLLGMLRELDAAAGGSRIEVQVIDTEPYSQAARDAKRNFNISPRQIPTGPQDDRLGVREVFLGVAFTRGPEQFVIPFLARGLPVEYELARSIRTVTGSGRKTVGILESDLALMGDFNYQTYSSTPSWPIVDELRKQYDVVRVNKGQPIRDDLDVLIVPQPSLLTNEELGPVVDAIARGQPSLVMEDPMPFVNPNLATTSDRGAALNPFERQQMPEQPPKADLTPLWTLLGIRVEPDSVIWDSYNPHPQMEFEREIVFITPDSGAAEAFNPREAVTSGLQEVVFMMPGELTTLGTGEQITPLVYTSSESGRVQASTMLLRSFFGIAGFNPNRQHIPTTEAHALVVAVRGLSDDDQSKPLNVILSGDIDFMSPAFFQMREQGIEDFNFDNVTFVLNMIDVLAGDESLVELRKRRPAYRTLRKLDAARQVLKLDSDSAIEQANRRAKNELEKARAALQKKVDEIKGRTELDDTTRRIMIDSVSQAEERRFEVRSAAINDTKQSAINEAETEARQRIARVQTQIRLAAVLLPPIPALALAGLVFVRRRAQELEGVERERLR